MNLKKMFIVLMVILIVGGPLCFITGNLAGEVLKDDSTESVVTAEPTVPTVVSSPTAEPTEVQPTGQPTLRPTSTAAPTLTPTPIPTATPGQITTE